MKWTKALTVLASRKKIDSAAMFDMQGNLLTRTDNFAEKQEHVDAVLNVLTSASHLKLLKLRVFGDVFTCVCPGPAGILLAHAQGRLFVGVRSPCCMVIAFANQGARGSCLYEVMEFTKLLESKVCPYSKPYTLPEPTEEPGSHGSGGGGGGGGDHSEASTHARSSSDEDCDAACADTAPYEVAESYEDSDTSEVSEPYEDSEASEASDHHTEPSEDPEFSDDACPPYSELYTLPESSEEPRETDRHSHEKQ